jgi:hypothetical protein
MCMCPIPNGFQDRDISLYSSLDLASNIVLPSHHTVPLSEACESVWSVSWPLWLLIDILRVLWKMPHIFTNAEYADVLYIYDFCDGSSTAAVEEYCQRFPVCRIPVHRVFSKVFSTLSEHGTLPTVHV